MASGFMMVRIVRDVGAMVFGWRIEMAVISAPTLGAQARRWAI